MKWEHLRLLYSLLIYLEIFRVHYIARWKEYLVGDYYITCIRDALTIHGHDFVIIKWLIMVALVDAEFLTSSLETWSGTNNA
jgi:hypothetical protein